MQPTILVIDPKSKEQLKTDAPVFWSTLTSNSKSFHHCQLKSDEFLCWLQIEYSRIWVNKLLEMGHFHAGKKLETGDFPDLDSISREELVYVSTRY